MIVLGFTFMMALYILDSSSFAPRPSKSHFSLFCAVMFIQSVACRHWLTIIWLHEPTEFNFLFELFMMSVGAYFGTGLFVTFVAHIFPEEFPKWFTKIVWTLCLILFGLNVVMGPAEGSPSSLTVFLMIFGVVGPPLLYFFDTRKPKQAHGLGLGLGRVPGTYGGYTSRCFGCPTAVEWQPDSHSIRSLGLFLRRVLFYPNETPSLTHGLNTLSENLQTEVDERTHRLEAKTLEHKK